MQHFSTISEIKTRAAGIGLAMTRLAGMAGVAASTAVGRVDAERDVRASTLRKLGDAVVAEEIRLRDYLLALHPITEAQEELA
jgi:predicted transcriptional regulator